ncbi:unnamed protein product [Pieris macdunnoughi]|uniref:Uncharacterized protein n=1 Tax=Pieris macdunnoughi TaxID=345717 RepID=A0A821LK56_9NEOP|nr:unnamed protein product [Pieris macdunnoughi]
MVLTRLRDASPMGIVESSSQDASLPMPMPMSAQTHTLLTPAPRPTVPLPHILSSSASQLMMSTSDSRSPPITTQPSVDGCPSFDTLSLPQPQVLHPSPCLQINFYC